MQRIALYGRSGSGKSTVAKYLCSKGFVHCKTGAACRRIALELFGSESKAIMNQLTDALRSVDSTVWLRAALRDVDPERVERIVFDSMRFQPDLAFLRDRGFVTVKINAAPETRATRLTDRGQEFDLATDDLHAAEIELAQFSFDFEIINDGSLEQLHSRVEAVLHELQA